jgi:hypothetical protein
MREHPGPWPPLRKERRHMNTTITVREYLEGEEERPVFLHTHCGSFQVTGVHFFGDGPWLVTGRGLNQASWCVSYGERLYFDQAEAERSTS